jgi:FKBP-type peptidyl-prolyl cis-trans isomerase
MRLVASLLSLAALSCGDSDSLTTEEAPRPDPASAPVAESSPGEPIDRGDGLLVEILERGSGTAIEPGRSVKLHYASYLAEGWSEASEPFDSSLSRGVPLSFGIGRAASSSSPRVIEGLSRGVTGLTPGSRARLRVPAALAWGEAGNPASGVPANADLVYEVHVLEVE